MIEVDRDAARKVEEGLQIRSAVLSLQQHRLALPRSGWAKMAAEIAKNAAARRPDGALRDQVAATFQGLDETQSLEREHFGASSLAFDREGRRLVMGGLSDDLGTERCARVLDLVTGRVQYSDLTGNGPVAFRGDGVPCKLGFQPPDRLVLKDVAGNIAIHTMTLPVPEKPKTLALADDGSRIAAALSASIFVWDATSGKRMSEIPGRFRALAFSPGAELLAAGDNRGRIIVWSLDDGRQVAELRDRSSWINSLRFTRDYLTDASGKRGWLLAAGGMAGSLVIWDITAKRPPISVPGHRL